MDRDELERQVKKDEKWMLAIGIIVLVVLMVSAFVNGGAR
jgi:uncharacterized membrane protein YhdT